MEAPRPGDDDEGPCPGRQRRAERAATLGASTARAPAAFWLAARAIGGDGIGGGAREECARGTEGEKRQRDKRSQWRPRPATPPRTQGAVLEHPAGVEESLHGSAQSQAAASGGRLGRTGGVAPNQGHGGSHQAEGGHRHQPIAGGGAKATTAGSASQGDPGAGPRRPLGEPQGHHAAQGSEPPRHQRDAPRARGSPGAGWGVAAGAPRPGPHHHLAHVASSGHLAKRGGGGPELVPDGGQGGEGTPGQGARQAGHRPLHAPRGKEVQGHQGVPHVGALARHAAGAEDVALGDLGEAAAAAEDGERGSHHAGGGEGVEHSGHAATPGHHGHQLGEGAVAGGPHRGGAQGPHQGPLPRAARGSQGGRAQLGRGEEVEGSEAHPAGRAVNQHALAGRNARGLQKRQLHGAADGGERGGLLEAQGGGLGLERTEPADHDASPQGAGGEPEHGASHREPRAGTRAHHHAGAVGAGGARVPRVHPQDVEDVTEVQADGSDGDLHGTSS